LRADERFAQRSEAKLGVRVQEHYKFVLGAVVKVKTPDDTSYVRAGVTTVPAAALAKAGQLTHIVRVSASLYICICQLFSSLLKFEIYFQFFCN
jgi:hypothetical protein